MKRPRPYIPINIRLDVASRQCDGWITQLVQMTNDPKTEKLRRIILYQFHPNRAHLDHDPALINRKYNPRTEKYTPDANDPNYLIYRKADDHRTKTIVRGEHGQYSDLGLRRKNKRIAANRNPNRRKVKIKNRKANWPKRPFPKRQPGELPK